MRDWPKTLRPASFRGVKFFVEQDTVETGRRLVIHQFPHRDQPYVEDLGREANKINVTAYVLGDDADGQEAGLRRACEARGAAQLSLPIGKFKAHCEKASRVFAKDKQGYIAFSLAFVRDGGPAAPFGVPMLGELVRLAAGGLAPALATSFLGRFATVGLPGFVKLAAVVGIRDIAVSLDVMARGMALSAVLAAPILTRIATLYRTAESLADVGARPARLERQSYVDTSIVALDAPIVPNVLAIIGDLRESSTPAAFLAAIEPLVVWSAPDDGRPAATPARAAELANAVALETLVRGAAIAHLAAASVSESYPDRRAAVAARARLAERFDAQLALMSGSRDHALHVALAEIRGQAVEHLSARVVDLAPVIVAGAERPMPSLWWSHRLYGTAHRASELVARNRVIHPSFMPREIEAAAR